MPTNHILRDKHTFLLVTANNNERHALLNDKAFGFSAPKPSPLKMDSSHYSVGEISQYSVIHLHLPVQGSAKSGASHTSILRAIEAWSPDAVILVGIAYGKHNEEMDEPRQHIGDVLISDKIADYESGKESDEGFKPDGEIPKSGRYLHGAFNTFASSWSHRINGRRAEYEIGTLLSGDKVVDNKKKKQEYFNRYPRAIGGEMEGRGAYAACHDSDLNEWIIVKAICDWGESKSSPDKEKNQTIAAKSAVSLLKYVLSQPQAFQNLPKKQGFPSSSHNSSLDQNENQATPTVESNVGENNAGIVAGAIKDSTVTMNVNAPIGNTMPSSAQIKPVDIKSITNMVTLRKLLRDHTEEYKDELVPAVRYMSEHNNSELRKLCQELIATDRTDEALFNAAIHALGEGNQNELAKVFESLYSVDGTTFDLYFNESELLHNQTIRGRLTKELVPDINAYHADTSINLHSDDKIGLLSFFGRKKRRFYHLAKEYGNISEEALKAILNNYVQQDVVQKFPEATETKTASVKDLLNIINKQSLVLIGRAGFGKSTAVRWLFLHAKGVVSYIRMSNLNGHNRSEILDEFKKTLVENQLVFLDGLDELATSFDELSFIQVLTDHFVSQNIRFVISMRADHYQGILSLLKKYFSSGTLTHRRGLSAFEIQNFTQHQFVRAACLVKRLGEVDPIHFKNKYPYNIESGEYKKLLQKAYTEQALFSIPLFSRYAHPLTEALEKGSSISTAVKKIIKWECHDCIESGNTMEQESVFTFLEGIISAYLVKIALLISTGETVKTSSIENTQIEMIKNPLFDFILNNEELTDPALQGECQSSWKNLSLCLLCLSDDGELVSFQHNIFKEYFLASHFANSDLLTIKEDRDAFIRLSSNSLFIEEYANQLLANGKIEILYDNVQPDQSYQGRDKAWYCKWFVGRLYTMMSSKSGVKIKPSGKLAPVVQLIPNLRVNCEKKSGLSPLWHEIYDLRNKGMPVTPAMAISNAKDLALSLCHGVLSENNPEIWEEVYELHKELFFENEDETEIETVNHIALIYARTMQLKYPRDFDKTYAVMHGSLSQYYKKLDCETSRYFCYWYADILMANSVKAAAILAKHGLRQIPNVPLNTDIQLKLYYKILQADVFQNDWDEFDKYYEMASEINTSLPWFVQRYKVACLIKKKEYYRAFKLLEKYQDEELSNLDRSYYLYLLGIIKCRSEEFGLVPDVFSEMEGLSETMKDYWNREKHKMRFCELKMKHYYDTHNKKALSELASENLETYREWNSSSLSGVEYIIDGDTKKKADFMWLINECLWS